MCSAEKPCCCLVRFCLKTFLKKQEFGGEQDWKVREGLEPSCPQPFKVQSLSTAQAQAEGGDAPTTSEGAGSGQRNI